MWNGCVIYSDELVTAFDDSKELSKIIETPDIDGEDISLVSFLKVCFVIIILFVESISMECTNRRIHSESQSYSHSKLHQNTSSWRTIYDICFTTMYWCHMVYLQLLNPSFSDWYFDFCHAFSYLYFLSFSFSFSYPKSKRIFNEISWIYIWFFASRFNSLGLLYN